MDPISLFRTVLSIITTFRDAFPSLASDATDWKNYEFFDRARWIKLLGIINNIERWQRRWMVYSDEAEQPGSLQSEFWGPAVAMISEHLWSISHEARKLGKLLNTRKIDQGGYVAVLRGKGRDILSRPKSNLSRTIESLDTLVYGLERISNEAYWHLRRHDLQEKDLEPPDTVELHQFGHQYHLVKLAMHTFLTSNQLHECCLNRELTLEFEIELDLFFRQHLHDGIVPRSRVIAEAAHTQSLGYTLFVSNPKHGDGRRVRLIAGPQRSLGECKTLFSEAFDVVCKNPRGEVELELATKGTRVTMRLDELQNVDYSPEPIPLRQVLSLQRARDTPDGLNLEKIKRAFHISEFFLLFFKSKWVKWICSCNIQEYDLSTLATTSKNELLIQRRYLFAVKGLTREDKDVPPAARAAASVTAIGLGTGTATLKPCWCQLKLSDDQTDKAVAFCLQRYPLFSLGLVLVEIGLERPLQEIRMNKGVVDMNSIFFGYHESSYSDPIVTKSLAELRTVFNDVFANNNDDDNERAKRVGADFFAAIEFCLTSRESSGADKRTLEKFFKEVVWKLWFIQDNLESAKLSSARV
ncbi:hypothetical protein QBC41DRAFT_281675 [Cercophora samala]|uniref:Uncharacterized protein n=1 Tax=Cercophora samala TaxID=330535 RepID=A0AA40D9Z5_9PEZI|nr:hypothetical protein QBC41DRAFT_281675 [Cercophora samala]